MKEQVNKLTLREKISLLEGVDSWHTRVVPRLGIPSLRMTDGPHGVRLVRREKGGFGVSDNLPATAFPTSATLAATWDPAYARRVGAAIGAECREMDVQLLLAPGVNIKRSPLCGRNFEYYAEDPLLSGVFGAAFVQGVQSQGVGCCVKHFAANSNEDHRFVGDSVVDDRALREIYLRAFERIVREADPAAVMCAYNRLNGVWASENRWLLTDVLRKEWGFDGPVLTDWGAARDRVAGVAAGCDLDMPGGVRHARKTLTRAAKTGDLSSADLDRAAERVASLADRCAQKREDKTGQREDPAALALAVAREGAVLLKNDGALPLTGGEKLLVVGEMFEKMRFQGAGSSLINPRTVTSPRDAFAHRGVRYDYEKGYRCFYTQRQPDLEQAALDAAQKADTVLFFGGLTDFEESEGFDRPHMRLGENQTVLLEGLLAAGKRVVLVLFAGSPVELPFFDKLAAVLYMVLPGMMGGEAAAQLLYGEANPSGRLTESWPLRAEESGCAADFGNGPVSLYYESIYVGYRFYDKAKTALRFPFGYGLSYTSFVTRDLEVSRDGDRVTVRLTVENTGDRAGAETVQVYAGCEESGVFRAEKELRAFQKVFLKAGESRQVTLTFPKTDLGYWHTGLQRWVVESGTYTVRAAAHAADKGLTAVLTISDGENPPSPYSAEVAAAYAAPPADIPAAFAQLVPCPVDRDPDGAPLTMESPLRDFERTRRGRLVSRAVMALVSRDYYRALKLPDSLERDSRLKNAYFVVKMMPANSMRSMCMSSGGRFPYGAARFCLRLAGGKKGG